jgi:cysteinyl-tRNA synthetase
MIQNSNNLLALIATLLAVGVAFRLLRSRHRYEEDTEHMREAILLLEEALNGTNPFDSSTNNDSSSPPAQSLSQRLNEIRSTKQQLTTLLSSLMNTSTTINQNKSYVTKAIDQNITAKVKISDLNEIFEILSKTEQLLSREEKVGAYQQQALERLTALQRERKHLWTLKTSDTEVQSTMSSLSQSSTTVPVSNSTSQDVESEGRVF